VDQILESRRLDPDYNPRQEEDEKSLRDLIKQTLRASVEIQGGYHEGGSGTESKWLIPVLVSLTVAFILGGVALTVTVSALSQEVTDLKGQVEKVERIVEPRYRGSP
jgi:hypothetical protein